MAEPKKIILVSATWAPFHSKLRKICEELASDANLEFEEKLEDWIFLKKHGEKDELGGSDIPQVFIEYDDGSIKHILTKVPLKDGKPDFEEAKEILKNRIS
ncbi:MAG TPA: hypothetical protein ENG40_02000 [Thermoprotei archaeon]|nr:MAG: hypothetical protein DRJ41_04860 [Thermoprotei archaeon]HDJ89452.1 hypothetical protein [Thermoprotei archaeon]